MLSSHPYHRCRSLTLYRLLLSCSHQDQPSLSDLLGLDSGSVIAIRPCILSKRQVHEFATRGSPTQRLTSFNIRPWYELQTRVTLMHPLVLGRSLIFCKNKSWRVTRHKKPGNMASNPGSTLFQLLRLQKLGPTFAGRQKLNRH